MKFCRYLMVACLLVPLAVAAPAALAVDYAPSEGTQRGVIQDLDFARNTITIDGYRYRMIQTARVEIAGSYGAFTMLRRGMSVEFSFRRYDDNSREIFALRELARGEVVEQT